MKKMMMAALTAALLVPVSLGNIASAQHAPSAPEMKANGAGAAKVSVSQHKGTFNGVKMDYTATAGETMLKNKGGDVIGRMFSVSYVKDNVKDKDKRPVWFIYNGGPGSSTVWLHMGAFGPKRIDIPSDARDDGAAPFSLIDNPNAPLDVADLVFVDPIGTGFSQLAGKGKGKDFWGVTEDARSIANFIRVWLRENGRWNSPKYIGGESYGTTRSAALINQLEGRFDDVAINGIILISTVLDFSMQSNDPGNELVYTAYLPTMAATAQYHGKAGAGKTTAAFVQESREWNLNVYTPALLKGNSLKGSDRDAIRSKLSYFTGLSEKYLENANLRVGYQRFLKELMRDEGYAIGRLDGRYKGVDFDKAGETPDTDPSFYGIDASYTAALNMWVRGDLNFNPDREYSIIGGLGGPWNWKISSRGRGEYLNVTPYIGRALRSNSDLRVLNAAGYYDFATPLYGAEYSLNRNGVPEGRVTYTYYEAGHMMYINHGALKALQDDIRNFIVAGGK